MAGDAWGDLQRARWSRLSAHAPGGVRDAEHFAARLMRENAWTNDETLAAIEEYRRFVFLACSGTPATPSRAVDAVWHAHLLYTRDYWLEFCPNVLGMPLHHEPGRGREEDARYAAQYARTLDAYERIFGPPPPRWWPRRAPAGAPPVRGRGLATASLLLSPALASASMRPANPLDWTGPEFLVLYVGLLLAVMIGSPLLRRWLRRRVGDVRDGGVLSTLETAYLAGGPARAVDAGVAELHRRGVLHWNAQSERFEARDADVPPLDAPLGELARTVASAELGAALRRAQRTMAPVRSALERRGLYLRAEDARRIARWSALPAAALFAFGLAKVAIGVQRDRPVTVLAILCVITAIYALVMFAGSAKPTRAGEQALARKRAAQRPANNGRTDDLGLAVALGGTALLSGTALAAYHERRVPSSSSDSSSSSSSSDSGSDSGSGDSGGGSSCGGCGGGGD